jgi:hypothetical protein
VVEPLEKRELLDVAGQKYVAQLYREFLQRQAGTTELSALAALLDQGTSRSQVARIVESSGEYQTVVLKALYPKLLGRPADPDGLSILGHALAGGAAVEQVEATLLGSPEYFQKGGNTTNSGFLDNLFLDTLNRHVDPTGLAAFQQQLAGGTTRQQIAGQILQSAEYQQDLVQADFQRFLHRAADPTAVSAFTSLLQNGGRDEDVNASLTGSDEYYVLQVDPRGTPNQLFVSQAYLDLLHRPVDASALTFWTGQLNAGTLRGDVAHQIETSSEYRGGVVGGLYQKLLGRSADAGAVTAFVNLLASGGTVEQVRATLLGSDEYFQKGGNTTNDGFLDNLFLDTLGRHIDPGALPVFRQQLQAGTSRATVALTILTSVEYRQDFIQSAYQRFLQHAADSGGLSAFTGLLQNGGRDEDVNAALVGSGEYLSRLESAPAFLAPIFAPVGPLAVMPGHQLTVQLQATDPNNLPVMFSLSSMSHVPTGGLDGMGRLTFTPTPAEVGTYTFALIASDGQAQSTQQVTLAVAPDPVTTTRLSGVLQNVNQQPLAGVTMQVNGVKTTTAADGSFLLDFGSSPPQSSDRLQVHGEGIAGSVTYPFVAENLDLLLAHGVFGGVNNVITRPIFLPQVDVASGKKIDPAHDTTVGSSIPNASLLVKAGTLMDTQGNPFTGTLSITQVPTSLTPAALPPNLHPSKVVTIQPGNMTFTTPAPFTMPNDTGFAPGTMMNLWSINPTTGLFAIAGTGQVSADGSVIQPLTGGIHFSSWHFYAPVQITPTDPQQDAMNPNTDCGCDEFG